MNIHTKDELIDIMKFIATVTSANVSCNNYYGFSKKQIVNILNMLRFTCVQNTFDLETKVQTCIYTKNRHIGDNIYCEQITLIYRSNRSFTISKSYIDM